MAGLSNAPKNSISGDSGSNNNNGAVVTGGGAYKPPKGLLDAISEIQQLKVIESGGNHIDSDFFSIQQRLDYYKVGSRSGMKESVFMFLLFPIFGWIIPSYLNFFYGGSTGADTQLLLLVIAILPALSYIGLCMFLANLYRGQITKMAINALLTGRSMVMAMLGFFIFVVYYMLYQMSLTKSVSHTVISIFFAIGKATNPHLPKLRAYYELFYYQRVRPDFLDIAVSNLIILLLSALVPIFTLYLKYYRKKYKAYRAKQKLEGKC